MVEDTLLRGLICHVRNVPTTYQLDCLTMPHTVGWEKIKIPHTILLNNLDISSEPI